MHCYTSYSSLKKYDTNRLLSSWKCLCHMRARIFFFFLAWLVAMPSFGYHMLPQMKEVLIEFGSASEAEE